MRERKHTYEDSTTEMLKKTKKQLKEKGIKKEISEIYTGLNYRIFEPKKNNRFILEFDKSLEIPSYLVKGFKRPYLSFDASDTISIEFYDSVDINISGLLKDMCLQQKKFNLKLKLVDPTGDIIETWKIKKCLINNIFWSELNYQNDDISTLTIDIKFKKIKIYE
jgi:hypothetical protein